MSGTNTSVRLFFCFLFLPLQWHQCLHCGYSLVSLSKSSHKLSADSFAVVAADTDDDHNDICFLGV